MISLNKHTCVVIGDPIRHSLSPLMHTAGYRKLGVDDVYSFLSEQVSSEQLKSCIDGLRAIGVRGISVTLPHKTAIMEYLDEIDPIAARIGAVNTVVLKDGGLTGFNTDVIGIVAPLETRCELKGQTALVLGAGGAARAAVAGLCEKEVEVTVANRSVERGETLAQDFEAKFLPLANLSSVDQFGIIINTTPVGMLPNVSASPLSEVVFQPGQIIFDAIYNPLETRLLLDAGDQGAKTISGVEMFVAQGAAQFELYTGLQAPVEAMRNAVLDHLKEDNN